MCEKRPGGSSALCKDDGQFYEIAPFSPSLSMIVLKSLSCPPGQEVVICPPMVTYAASVLKLGTL